MATGLVAFEDRAADGGPLLTGGEEETIVHIAPEVSIVFGDSNPQQRGTLYITTRRLIWLSDDEPQKGYSVGFLSLSMHAISRDPEAYPEPCIYTQIEHDDDGDEWDEVDEMEESEESVEKVNHVEEDLSAVTEMRLVPRNPDVLDQLFQVLCDCALLNPDPHGEEEGEGEWFFNVNEVLGRPIGEDNSEVPNISELQLQDPRFEDAEEELDEEGPNV